MPTALLVVPALAMAWWRDLWVICVGNGFAFVCLETEETKGGFV
jgi:hypothetical protein